MDPILWTLFVVGAAAVVGLVVVPAILNARTKSLGQRRQFGERHGLTKMRRRGF